MHDNHAHQEIGSPLSISGSYLRTLQAAHVAFLRMRETAIVDDNFPRARDEADLAIGRLTRFANHPPKIVCLCGSTRFMDTFYEQMELLTLQGCIVLSVGCNAKKESGTTITANQKKQLDELHKRKIDLADEVLVLNRNGYIGESTRGEIAYAERMRIPVRYLES